MLSKTWKESLDSHEVCVPVIWVAQVYRNKIRKTEAGNGILFLSLYIYCVCLYIHKHIYIVIYINIYYIWYILYIFISAYMKQEKLEKIDESVFNWKGKDWTWEKLTETIRGYA